MAVDSDRVGRVFADAEADFLFSRTRVTMKLSIDNLEAGDVKFAELKEGATLEVPRWVAEEFARLGVAEISEEPFENELFRALSREKLMGPLELSPLPRDFYVRMKRRIALVAKASAEGKVGKQDLEKLRGTGYDLIGVRLSKLLSLSSTSNSSPSLAGKLTPEESAFLGASQARAQEWKGLLLDGTG